MCNTINFQVYFYFQGHHTGSCTERWGVAMEWVQLTVSCIWFVRQTTKAKKPCNFLLMCRQHITKYRNRILSEGIKVTDQIQAFTSSPFSTARKTDRISKLPTNLIFIYKQKFINLFSTKILSPFLRDLFSSSISAPHRAAAEWLIQDLDLQPHKPHQS